MKYIIAGLGSFGSSLGMALTSQGHEVIAIDSSMQKVEAYKEAITHTICMDATDEYTVNGLPIMDTDIVVVAIGVDDIFHPEKESAMRWAKRLSLRYFVDSFELTDNFSIVEIAIPTPLIGKQIATLQLENRFNIKLLSTMHYEHYQDSFGRQQSKPSIQGLATPEQVLQENDVLVVYGANKHINNFLRSVGVKVH